MVLTVARRTGRSICRPNLDLVITSLSKSRLGPSASLCSLARLVAETAIDNLAAPVPDVKGGMGLAILRHLLRAVFAASFPLTQRLV